MIELNTSGAEYMQKLRDHYERQNTEELLDIAKQELTDEARTILGEELAKRGVQSEQIVVLHESANAKRVRDAEVERNLASRFIRFVAFAIDVWGVLLVLFVILSPLRLFSGELHTNSYVFIWLAYFLLRDSIPGQSLGKRLLGIRAVSTETGLSCTWTKSFVRNLTHLFFVLDALVAFGERRRRFGDWLADTKVVHAS